MMGLEWLCTNTKCPPPPRGKWTNWDFVAATKVLVEIFLAGDDRIPILSELLNKMSARIKSSRKAYADTKASKKKSKQNKRKPANQPSIVSFFQKVFKPNEASENSEPKKKRAKKNQNSKKVQAKKTGPPKKKPLKKKKSPKTNATKKTMQKRK